MLGETGNYFPAVDWLEVGNLEYTKETIYACFSCRAKKRRCSLPQDCCNNKAISGGFNWSAPRRAKKTTSMGGENCSCLNVSLTTRFKAFLLAAEGTFFFPTTRPKRECRCTLNLARIKRFGWEILQVLASKTSWKSDCLSKRLHLPNFALGAGPMFMQTNAYAL